MPTRTVKWFDATKGYGFIAPEVGSKDVFVHGSTVERAGPGTLREGQRLRYEVRPGRDGRTTAEEPSAADWTRKTDHPDCAQRRRPGLRRRRRSRVLRDPRGGTRDANGARVPSTLSALPERRSQDGPPTRPIRPAVFW